MFTFQELIFNLSKYWSNLGSYVMYSLDIEIGAATFHPITFFNCLKGKDLFFYYIQLCRRPNDSFYGKSSNKLQQYYQFQVIIKPFLGNVQKLYLNSLKYLGINLCINELRFIENNWKNPTLGAYGLGWEIWLNGMEISQFTYFQKIAGFNCIPVIVEITYGLERIALYLQNKDNIYDLIWDKNKNGIIYYKDIFLKNEIEKSIYNLKFSDVNFLIYSINNYESEIIRLLSLDNPLIIISYEFAIKIVYYFNLLDARNYFSNIERQRFILRIRKLFFKIANIYLNL